MSSPQYSILYSAPLSATVASGAAMDVLINDAASVTGYVLADTVGRAGRRSTGIALSPYTAGGVVDIQQEGQVASAVAGLGAGTASLVRVSTLGKLERAASPGATDDVVGYIETDGTLHLRFGQVPGGYGSGGGSTFTPPTGTGLVTVTGGVLNAASTTLPLSAASVVQATGTGIPHVVAGVLSAASSLIVNADVSASAAIAASKVVQATGTGIPHVVAGALSAASSLIVDADVSASAAVAVSKLAPGTNTYVLTTTGGVAVWAAPAGGGGLGTYVLSGTGYISIGPSASTVPTTGALRLGSTGSLVPLIVWSDGATDNAMVTVDTVGNGCSFGFDTCVQTKLGGATIVLYAASGSTYIYAAGGQSQTHDGAVISSFKPMVGSQEFGAVDGMTQVVVSTVGITLSAAQVSRQVVKLTGTPGAIRTITFPLPTSDDTAYVKTVWAAQTVSGVTITNTGGTTVSLGAGSAPCTILFTALGAVRLT